MKKYLSAGVLFALICNSLAAVAAKSADERDPLISLPTDWDVGSTHHYHVQWSEVVELLPSLPDAVNGDEMRVKARGMLRRSSIAGDVSITVVKKTASGYDLRWEPTLSAAPMPNISPDDAAAIGRELRRYLRSIPLELTVDLNPKHEMVRIRNVSTIQHLTLLRLIELLGQKSEQLGCEDGFSAGSCPLAAMTGAAKSQRLAMEAIEPFFGCTGMTLNADKPTEWNAPHPNSAIGAAVGVRHRVAVVDVDPAKNEVQIETSSIPDSAQMRDWMRHSIPAEGEPMMQDLLSSMAIVFETKCAMDLRSGWPVTLQQEGRLTNSVLVGLESIHFDRVDQRQETSAPLRSRSDTNAAQAAFDRGDYAAALRAWQRSAAAGSAMSQERLGTMYLLGLGVRRNCTKALEWYNKAAEQGHAAAQFKLSEFYCCGAKEVHADAERAIRWLQAAANQGHAEAQLKLGMKYDQGDGVPQDLALAVEWYRKSAMQGVAVAQHNLGEMYHAGAGVDRDDVEASNWYRKAADQGFAPSQYNIGVLFRDGEGLARDHVQALSWFRRAADQGLALAQAEAGMLLYSGGDGVTQNLAEAFTLLRAAAEQDDPSAMCVLGGMYWRGDAVARDNAQAYRWMNRSVKLDARCLKALDQLNQQMTPEDLERSKALLELDEKQAPQLKRERPST